MKLSELHPILINKNSCSSEQEFLLKSIPFFLIKLFIFNKELLKVKDGLIIGILLIIIVFFQCSKEPGQNKNLPKENNIALATPENKNQKPVIHYSLISLKKDSLFRFNSKTSNDTIKVLLYLNRVDKLHLFRQDTIVVPDTFISNLMVYSPFPDSISGLKPIHKLIFFSYPIQAFAVYENGILIRWGPVSMGKESTITPTGLFHTNWRSKRAISTINRDWIMNWYFNLDNFRGVSMHEYELPGYPASHACIRMIEADALWFYNWADSWMLFTPNKIGAYGTPVMIHGAYPFGKRKPWLALADNNKALQMRNEDLTAGIQDYFPLIMERQIERDSLLSKRKNKFSLK